MKYLKQFEKTLKYEGNGKLLFLNPQNFRWVRMSKEYYDAIKNNEKQFEMLLKKFETKFGLFDSQGEDCNIRSIYFAVTKRCNLQCTFCTMNSGPNVSTVDDLTLEEIKEILIPKLMEISPKKIVITGGEPTLRQDILDVLKAFANFMGKERILLQTNGLLLSKKFVKEVAPYIGAIEISIENIFDNVSILEKMKNIFGYIRAERIELSLSFVLDKESKEYLWKAVDLCHCYGGVFTLRVVSQVGRAAQKEYQDEIMSERDVLNIYYSYFSYLLENNYLEDKFISGYINNLQPKKACGAYGKILSIHPDGTTYMCGNFKTKAFSMGNIQNNTISEISENLKKKLKDDKIKNKFLVDMNSKCVDCQEKYFCPGVCRAELEECGQETSDNKCLSKKAMIYYDMFYYNGKSSVRENFESFVQYLGSVLKGEIQIT